MNELTEIKFWSYYGVLSQYLTMPIEDFAKNPKKYGQLHEVHYKQVTYIDKDKHEVTYQPPPEWYLYKDNGANVLAVAHLDVAIGISKVTKSKNTIYSTTLDDRLGVFTILHVLPYLGINVDWLFTTGEESGQSTADGFVTDKQYNWIVEFDRRGKGAVHYQYGSDDWCNTLEAYFQPVESGTFTDICDLDHLGCKALNVAIGYYNEHTTNHHMSVKDYVNQLNTFAQFYRDNCGIHFPHDEDNPEYGRGYRQYKSWYYDYESIDKDDVWDSYTYSSTHSKNNNKTAAERCLFCDCERSPFTSSAMYESLRDEYGSTFICDYDLDWLASMPLDEAKIIIAEEKNKVQEIKSNGKKKLLCAHCDVLTDDAKLYCKEYWLCPDCYKKYTEYDEKHIKQGYAYEDTIAEEEEIICDSCGAPIDTYNYPTFKGKPICYDCWYEYEDLNYE